jgi:hypothetical protein
MHYHLEIIMPPVDDVVAAIERGLGPFCEGNEDSRHQWWDWFVVGGRYAGQKFQATLDNTKLDAFYAAMRERKVTVSSLTAGKQELKPESQIPMVDALWNEYFPESNGSPCPLFNHSNDQYKSDSLIHGDICRFADVPSGLGDLSRVIFAAPNYDGTEMEATFMVTDDIWNGVNYEKTEWDGTFSDAVAKFRVKTGTGYTEAYLERVTPKDDWLVVTVDYHS